MRMRFRYFTFCLIFRRLFHSYFCTLVGKVVTVELKNDLAITGTLHSVDQVLPKIYIWPL